MKSSILISLLLASWLSFAQTIKTDTIKGVVVYTGYSNLRFIAKGNFHTYTAEATEVKADTGVVYIKTEFGYLDLKKNYQFYPLNKVQPAHLKGKPWEPINEKLTTQRADSTVK
jgi:hypothetical protein